MFIYVYITLRLAKLSSICFCFQVFFPRTRHMEKEYVAWVFTQEQIVIIIRIPAYHPTCWTSANHQVSNLLRQWRISSKVIDVAPLSDSKICNLQSYIIFGRCLHRSIRAKNLEAATRPAKRVRSDSIHPQLHAESVAEGGPQWQDLTTTEYTIT